MKFQLQIVSLLTTALVLTSSALFAEKNIPSTIARDLQLKSALSVPSAFSEPSISGDGSIVYVFMQNLPGFPIAQIYQNVHGVLSLRNSLNTDPAFPFSWDGYANTDFSRFSVIDIPSMSLPFMARFRLLDGNLNTVVSRILTGDSIPFLNAGRFSPDGQYVTFGYSQFATVSTSQTVFMILRTSDLSTYVQTTLPGWSPTSPLFEVNGKLYLAYQQTTGIPGDPANTVQQLPINLNVYRVDDSGLTLVDSKPLPYVAETDVVSYDKFALIAHGGFCSLFPNQTSIYDTNVGITTYQPNDNAEARVFQFNGKELELVVKEPVNCCNRTLIYPPDRGRTYFIGQNTDLGHPGERVIDREFFCLARLVKTGNGLKFQSSNLPQQDTFHAIPAFSKNGKWLFRTGTYGYADGMTPTDDVNGIHNLLLYKVTNFCND